MRYERENRLFVYVKVCRAQWVRETEATLLASGFMSEEGGQDSEKL